MTRRVTGVKNMTLSDTPRFPTRRVPICDSLGIVKYHGSKNFHEITHFTQGKGKNIFQLRKSLKVG